MKNWDLKKIKKVIFKIKMNLSLLAIIIYAAGILFGAFFLDIWGAETSILKGIIGLVWPAIFLITLFYAEKKNNKN